MILGIGVDVLQLSRISDLVRRRGMEKLASRILSPQESQHWIEKQSAANPAIPIRFLAVRFVATMYLFLTK
jgi:holo-[acyl-carrier protein] synthase